MTQYVGAIDQGTTSTRFIIFDHAGKIVSSAQREHTQITPRPGWVEHDAAEVWDATIAVVRGAMAAASITASDLVAVGITNQRETTLVWDEVSGEPLANAIVWQDTRTDDICTELAGDQGPGRFRDITGLPLATYFSGPKLRWLLDNVPAVRAAADAGTARFGTMDSWIIWKLTGRHATDVTNASRTMLMSLDTLEWDDGLLAAMGIPRSVLPEILPSVGIFATARAPLEGVPIAADLGDQQAALLGQTCFTPGEAKNTYGTGCFLLLHTGTERVASGNGLLTTVAYRIGDDPACYALEGSIAIAGAGVQWLRDNLGLIDQAPDVEHLAREVDDNGDVYLVPAFSGLFAPYWRPDARGAIVGLTRFTRAGHLARAALEATAYQTRDVLEAMEADSGVRLDSLKVDGGMVANDLLMQFQADILGVAVIRPVVSETTALGAAYGAGLATGFWSGLDELRSHWAEDRRYLPDMADERREALYARWKQAVTRTYGWAG